MFKNFLLALLVFGSFQAQARVCFVSLLEPSQHQKFVQILSQNYNFSFEEAPEIEFKFRPHEIKECLSADYDAIYILAHSRISALGDAAFVSYFRGYPIMLSDEFFDVNPSPELKKRVYVAACAPELFARYPNLKKWEPEFAIPDFTSTETHPSRVSSLRAAEHFMKMLSLLKN